MKKKKLQKQRRKKSLKKVFTPANTLPLQYFNSGRLQEAKGTAELELKANPSSPESLFVFGLVAQEQGNLLLAEEYLQRAAAVQPGFAAAYFRLGLVQNGLGEFHKSAASYKKVLSFGLNAPDIYNNLGNSLKETGELEGAVSCYKKALKADRNYFLGYFNLGNVLHMKGELQEAAACFKRVLTLNPAYYQALDNLGAVYDDLGQPEEAVSCYRRSLEINDRNPIAYNNLANSLRDLGLLQEAAEKCQKALALDENFASAHKNSGTICAAMGLMPEAVSSYRRSLAIKPDPAVHSNLLLSLHYLPDVTQEQIHAEAVRWDGLYARDLERDAPAFSNSRDENRPLRIGYVSPDFRSHSVAYFIEAVIEAHDRENCEVYCYANVTKQDVVTRRIEDRADHWRDIAGEGDASAAALIRKDNIDILVDLAGHTEGNRLQLFARRPAPVQVSWIGYPNTTGLAAMDYRLTDNIADASDEADELYSEERIRLPHGFLCYRPEQAAPPVTPPPCLASNSVTFGSFNNLSKTTPDVVRLWAEILRAVAGSRLILKSRGFSDRETARRFEQVFAAEGIGAERLQLYGLVPSKEEHLGLYRQVDIGLDPFPYNGTTTTCEALWMGVPVVTLLGDRHSGRVGASIMRRSGLDDMVAENSGHYLQLAVSLAGDTQRLAAMRQGMRQLLLQSPLLDSRSFSRDLEGAYRTMWSAWCKTS